MGDDQPLDIAIWDHAGIGDELTVVVGTLADDGSTIDRLRTEHGFDNGSVDFVFIDHDKSAYLPDLERIVGERWLHPGSIVVADNIKFPGAPEYRSHMAAADGKTWRTTEHEAHVEYQSLIKDLVLESRVPGPEGLTWAPGPGAGGFPKALGVTAGEPDSSGFVELPPGRVQLGRALSSPLASSGSASTRPDSPPRSESRRARLR